MMTDKEEARSAVTAQLTADEIQLCATNTRGWRVRFDKEPTKVHNIYTP